MIRDNCRLEIGRRVVW